MAIFVYQHLYVHLYTLQDLLGYYLQVPLDYREDVEKKVNQFRDAFNKGRILTKQLGVLSQVSIEDDDLTRLIEESVLNGACVAKLPGAGGRDSIAALCLDRDDQKLIGFWNSKKSISVLNIKVINQGAI